MTYITHVNIIAQSRPSSVIMLAMINIKHDVKCILYEECEIIHDMTNTLSLLAILVSYLVHSDLLTYAYDTLINI